MPRRYVMLCTSTSCMPHYSAVPVTVLGSALGLFCTLVLYSTQASRCTSGHHPLSPALFCLVPLRSSGPSFCAEEVRSRSPPRRSKWYSSADLSRVQREYYSQILTAGRVGLQGVEGAREGGSRGALLNTAMQLASAAPPYLFLDSFNWESGRSADADLTMDDVENPSGRRPGGEEWRWREELEVGRGEGVHRKEVFPAAR